MSSMRIAHASGRNVSAIMMLIMCAPSVGVMVHARQARNARYSILNPSLFLVCFQHIMTGIECPQKQVSPMR